MTPPRLVQIACVACQARQWIIDSDYRGTDGVPTDYEHRFHFCRGCLLPRGRWKVVEKSPSSFFIGPVMTGDEFDRWVGILRENFPDHPSLARLGKGWSPTPPPPPRPP